MVDLNHPLQCCYVSNTDVIIKKGTQARLNEPQKALISFTFCNHLLLSLWNQSLEDKLELCYASESLLATL